MSLWKDYIGAWFEDVKMSIHRFFRRQFPLRNRIRGIAFLCFILLMYGCGDESINAPLGGSVNGTTETEDFVPVSSIYFPMTLGNRWVYRSPDGSEWSREVTKTEEVGSHLYHFFSYGPLIDDDQLDSSETPTYTPTPYVKTLDGRLIYENKMSDLNDAVRQTIFESGRVPPNRWVTGTRCRTEGERAVAVCRLRKLETIVRDGRELQEINNDALMLFHGYDARVVWNSELTVLRIPLVPYRRWKAIDVRVSGTRYFAPFWDVDGVGETHSFEADVTISGIAGQPEPVVTPAGAFANCLKIRYEMTRLSFETTEFTVNRPVFEQRKLELFEAELRKELITLFRDGLPRMQLGAVWLAPDVGPVRIERADGISELISYDVKKGSNPRQVASGR